MPIANLLVIGVEDHPIGSLLERAQGFKREWKMRAESRSPAWTTRLDEVPVVVAR